MTSCIATPTFDHEHMQHAEHIIVFQDHDIQNILNIILDVIYINKLKTKIGRIECSIVIILGSGLKKWILNFMREFKN